MSGITTAGVSDIATTPTYPTAARIAIARLRLMGQRHREPHRMECAFLQQPTAGKRDRQDHKEIAPKAVVNGLPDVACIRERLIMLEAHCMLVVHGEHA
jgi:hypothetical protein